MHNLTQYDLKLLQVFRTVVECGGFTAAETSLNITRSTISIHIANLEQRLKLRLCHRGRQGFALTREGQQIYNGILQLSEAQQHFSRLVASLDNQLSGELVMLSSDQLPPSRLSWLAKVIDQLAEVAPELELCLDTAPLQHIELALLRDEAHLGLMPGYRQIDGLSYQPLFSTPIYLCCAQGHPLFDRSDADIDDALLASYPAIYPGVDIDPAGRAQLQKLTPKAKAYQFDTRLALLLSGRYLGYLPEELARPYQQAAQAPRLRFIKPKLYHYAFRQSLVRKQNPKEQTKVQLAFELFHAMMDS
ncbi:LysR family transcriptional regulator [Alkalimonas sp.]|uniref:LysR family transcriptional regulator n=1 Tax=Alkalimonas sp. TaxID=1872453 RepID=UPI00263B5AAF|nr:LysR family transcriptional regulator [Alkalimonas sp.]MCC5827795.1 LysR family transcriptional regulator [Alkalimonas sp.]